MSSVGTPSSRPSALFHHTSPLPTALKAHGLYITLNDGTTLLDAMSGGAAVASLGQGNEEVIQAMVEQAQKVDYLYHQSVGCEPAERLARALCEKGGFEAAAFLNSGSEAIEACIKLVRQYWVVKGQPERKYIIARFPAYHGNTLGALSISSMPGRRDIYAPLLSPILHHVPTPLYKRHAQPNETEEEYSDRLACQLEAKILELGPEKVMAFFVEPVQGSATGVMPPPRGYFPAISRILTKYDILLVCDEVMSGAGRCGEYFSHHAVGEGVKPDVLALAKGLGAGYVPISGIVVNKKVVDVVRAAGQWNNSQTYQNHPISCAVGLNVLEFMDRENLLENVRIRGEQLLRELEEAFEDVPIVYDVRGKGLFVGVEYDTPATLTPRFAEQVRIKAFENGLLILGISGTIDGKNGDSTLLAPAYTVTAKQISETVRLLRKAVMEACGDWGADA